MSEVTVIGVSPPPQTGHATGSPEAGAAQPGANESRPGEPGANQSRPGEPGANQSRPGELGANQSRPGECGQGPASAGSAGWIWGDPADGIPADAPLHMLLLAASRIMGAYYAGTVAQAGLRISPAGLGVLRVLLAADGLKSSDVAARGWSSPGTLTAVVNTLVREGYVERRRDAGDRRVVRLYATEKGRRTCADYYTAAGPHWRSAFGFVSQADEPVIRKFFTDMIEHFGELIRKERGR